MKCVKCKKKSTVKCVDKALCNRCFLSIIEKKFRKNFRKYEIKRNTRIIITDSLSKYFLLNVINIPLDIIEVPNLKMNISNVEINTLLKQNKAKYIALPLSIDDCCERFVFSLFNSKIYKENIKIIKLFRDISIDDINNYIKIKKINEKMFKRTGEIYDFINKFEKKYVGTKTSLLNSFEKVKEVIL